MYERYAYPDELYHYGVKGMKWGIINEDPKTQILKLKKKKVAQALAKKIKQTGNTAGSAVKGKDTRYKGPSNIPLNQKKSTSQYKGPTSIKAEQEKARIKANDDRVKAAAKEEHMKNIRGIFDEIDTNYEKDLVGKQNHKNSIGNTIAKEKISKMADKSKQKKADLSATEERDARQREANAQKSVDNLKKSVKSYIDEANKRAKLDVMVGGIGRKAKEAQEESKQKKNRAEVKYLGKHGGGGDHGSRTSTQIAVAKRNNKAKNLIDQINNMAVSKKKKKK